MIVIKATITTVGPLSIAMADAQTENAQKFNNFPMMVRGVTETGEKQETAYLPATTVRGFLRRAIVLQDMQAAAASGNHYTLDRAYAELIGQDARSEKQNEVVDLVALKAARESSPVLDLFGSGLGLKSRLHVSHFLPDHNIQPDMFSQVRKDLDATEGALESIADSEREMFYERNQANPRRVKAENLLKDLKGQLRNAEDEAARAGLKEQIEAAEKLVSKYEESMGEMQVSSKALFSHYAIGADIPLTGRLVVENPKDRDIELLLTGLNGLSLSPVLGAHSARGCGEIKGVFDFTRDGELFKRVTVGGYMPAEVDDF